jgi:ADP-ribosylglycohydrolase
VGASVATTESVPAAIGLFVRAKGDPLACALLSANLGGDTDTIGAIAGGLCGAFSGYSAIPEEYIEALNRVNDLGFEALADALEGFRDRS